MPSTPEQLSSAIKPGPVTLVNGVQCAFGDKVLLCLTVGSKTSTGNIKDGSLEGTPQLFRIPQSTQTPKSPLSLFVNSTTALSSLSLPTSSLGWDGTILLDLSCNFRVGTKSSIENSDVIAGCAHRVRLSSHLERLTEPTRGALTRISGSHSTRTSHCTTSQQTRYKPKV